jgi:hypothetical protein
VARADPGFSIEHGIFTQHEMQRVRVALADPRVPRTKAGSRHLMSLSPIRDLASDRRLHAIAARFVGPTAVPFRATLFDKSADANWLVVWHQDTAVPVRCRIDNPAWGPWSVKAGVLYAHAPAAALETVVALRVSLDDSTQSNGPLRVLPHSHVNGVLSDTQIEATVARTAAVDCPTESGGVVAMRPLTIHSSSKSVNGQPRRVLHIEYAAAMQLAHDVGLVVC